MVNKKGFFLAVEVVKIVVALICIGFLVYFLASLYFNGLKDKDKELAGESLDFLLKEIERGAERVDIYNPSGKWIFVFSAGSVHGLERPSSCLNWENCICICGRDDATDCNDWVCRESVNEVRIHTEPTALVKTFIRQDYIQIPKKTPPLKLSIKQIEGGDVSVLSPFGRDLPIRAGDYDANLLLSEIVGSVDSEDNPAYVGVDPSFDGKEIFLDDAGEITNLCVCDRGYCGSDKRVCQLSDYSWSYRNLKSDGKSFSGDLGDLVSLDDISGLNIYLVEKGGVQSVIVTKSIASASGDES